MTAVVVASLHKGLLIGVLQNGSANSSECLLIGVLQNDSANSSECLLIGVLQNDSTNSSECLMANVWLMGENLVEEGNIMVVLFCSATRQKLTGSGPDGDIWNFSLT